MNTAEAHKRLKGTFSKDKHNILFDEFKDIYNDLGIYVLTLTFMFDIILNLLNFDSIDLTLQMQILIFFILISTT